MATDARSPLRLRRLARGLLIAGLAAPLAATAQTPLGEGAFFERVDVELVDLEVLVTDRQGNPVPGLSRQDFRVFDDGKLVELTHFAAQGSRARPAAAPGAAAPGDGPSSAAPVEAASGGPGARAQRGLVALFLDETSLPPLGRRRTLEQLRPRVQSFLDAGDRLIVVTWNGSLRVRRSLDPALSHVPLEEVFGALEREAPGGLAAYSERRDLLRQIELASMPPPEGAGLEQKDTSEDEAAAAHSAVRVYLERRSHEGRATLLALERLVSSLAGLEGPKAILIVTGGLAHRPGEEMLEALRLKYAGAPRLLTATRLDGAAFDLTSQHRQVVERANAAGVVLHGFVVDTSGSPAENMSGALRPTDLDTERTFGALAGVGALAGPTGGLALGEPASGATWLTRLLDERQGTYSVAWVAPAPASASEGRARKVRVEVAREGLAVRHRTTVRPLTREARARAATMAALLLGDVVGETEIAILFGKVEAAPEVKGKPKGEIEVAIEVRFPLAQVVLLPGEQFHEGRVRLWVGAQDQDGQRSDLSRVEMPLRIPNEELLSAQGRTAAWRSRLRLRAVPHTVAVGLDDELGGTLTTARAVFDPRAPEGGTP